MTKVSLYPFVPGLKALGRMSSGSSTMITCTTSVLLSQWSVRLQVRWTVELVSPFWVRMESL